ncbi:MAG: hypothetical protein K2Q25_08385 [Mycobacteriaceae bacterium]|nr:hypothetical protein [Mycobacteriaceae bacterium]
MTDKTADALTATKTELIKMIEDDKDLNVHAVADALRVRSRISVTNRQGGTIWVKVSKACGAGQDGYWEIGPGGTETWMRCVYHRVNIRASSIAHDDTGIFADVEHTTAVSTGCNSYAVEGGSFVYLGPPDCL